MKRFVIFPIIVSLLLTICCCQGKQSRVSDGNIKSDSSVVDTRLECLDTVKSVATPLPYWKYRSDVAKQYYKHREQYSKNPLYQAYYEICLERDTTDNVLRKICHAGGFEKDGQQYPSILFTICLERDFCNSMVFKSMEKIIDSTFIDVCSYWEPQKTLNTIRVNNMPHTVDGIFHYVERVAQYITNDKKEMNRIRDNCYNATVDIVCRKVYETSDSVTFGLYSYVEYHGACGNGVRIRYYTVDKRSGHVLSTRELLKTYSKEQLNRKLLEQYKSVAYYINEYYDTTDLVSIADGCAILEDGYLFYYFPYNLGCGAEGQYNLVIQP